MKNEYYFLISVKEIKLMLKLAEAKAKHRGLKPGTRDFQVACTSLKMVTPLDEFATTVNGLKQINWTGETN